MFWSHVIFVAKNKITLVRTQGQQCAVYRKYTLGR